MNNPFKQRQIRMRQLNSIRQADSERGQKQVERSRDVEGVFTRCRTCGATCSKTALSDNLYVCPDCGYHHPIPAYLRLSYLLDPKSFKEFNRNLVCTQNPLSFPDYSEKLRQLKEKTGLQEAVVTATGKIRGKKAVLAVMDSRFMMASMGAVVGEKITRAIEYADKNHLPLIIFCASGGARMQEGIISLMQMAKTAAAIERFSKNGGLYISCLTHPTTGGVSASFATLGDITLAEPQALIGFAGPRVIEQTIGQKLPDGFQRAEYLETHGFVDRIVPRGQWREVLGQLLALHDKGGRLG